MQPHLKALSAGSASYTWPAVYKRKRSHIRRWCQQPWGQQPIYLIIFFLFFLRIYFDWNCDVVGTTHDKPFSGCPALEYRFSPGRSSISSIKSRIQLRIFLIYIYIFFFKKNLRICYVEHETTGICLIYLVCIFGALRYSSSSAFYGNYQSCVKPTYISKLT